MKIRQVRYKSGRVKWQVDLGIVVGADGKKRRDQRYYNTRTEAEDRLAQAKRERRDHGRAALAVPDDARARYAAAERRLAQFGGTLEEAVELWVRIGSGRRRALTLEALKEEYLMSREAKALRRGSVAALRCSLTSFCLGREEIPAHEVAPDDVRSWLASSGWSARTQRGRRADVSSMFGWAASPAQRVVVVNPCEGVETPRLDEGEITCMGVAQAGRLLELAAKGRDKTGRPWADMLGYVTVGLFGLVRPDEMARSGREVIDLDDGTLLVMGARGKTRQRRVVELPPNAVAWLREWYRLSDRPRLLPATAKERWKTFRRAAGWVLPWPHDIMRHTGASFHYALHRDEARLKAQMGHSASEDTLHRHYRAVRTLQGEVITPVMAAAFFALVPSQANEDGLST